MFNVEDAKMLYFEVTNGDTWDQFYIVEDIIKDAIRRRRYEVTVYNVHHKEIFEFKNHLNDLGFKYRFKITNEREGLYSATIWGWAPWNEKLKALLFSDD
jgi:hypothetical protein